MTESTVVLRLSQAARTLGMETREVAGLVYERRIRFVMIDGIAHIPPDALDELRAGRATGSASIVRSCPPLMQGVNGKSVC